MLEVDFLMSNFSEFLRTDVGCRNLVAKVKVNMISDCNLETSRPAGGDRGNAQVQ